MAEQMNGSAAEDDRDFSAVDWIEVPEWYDEVADAKALNGFIESYYFVDAQLASQLHNHYKEYLYSAYN